MVTLVRNNGPLATAQVGYDKNKDGYLSKDEVKGTPHEKDFSTLDKDGDGKLSREEHAAAPQHASDKSSAGGSTRKSDSSSPGSASGGASSPSSGASQGKGSKY